MARFSDYVDTDYLPGDVYSAGFSEYRKQPMDVASYIADKKFAFKPDADGGDRFQQFLALQANPQAFFMGKIKLPDTFETMLNRFGGQ